jgi:ATP-binding cassette subfamily B multidrug efflux pump
MMRIAKYIKPYLPLLAAAVVLLFIQAYANLSLPDYMSHIVNVGIQQGGVADAVPKALRKSQMDSLTLFMSATDAKRVLADYQLVQPGGSQSTRYLSDYPALRKEPIYVRGEINTSEVAAINPIMGKAWLVVAAIEQARENPAMARSMGLPEIGAEVGAGASDPSSLLKMLPAERRSEIASSIGQKFASMGPKMISQAATQPVKAEYAALGVNTSKLQTNYMLRTGAIMLLLTLIAAVTAVSTGSRRGSQQDLRATSVLRSSSAWKVSEPASSTSSRQPRSSPAPRTTSCRYKWWQSCW